MAQEPTKISDIKHPEKVTPEATSRPIIVTNRPIMTNDPMMASSQDPSGAPLRPEPMTRTAKTIIPLTDGLSADPDSSKEPETKPSKEPEAKDTKKTEKSEPKEPEEPKEDKPKTPKTEEPKEDSKTAEADTPTQITVEPPKEDAKDETTAINVSVLGKSEPAADVPAGTDTDAEAKTDVDTAANTPANNDTPADSQASTNTAAVVEKTAPEIVPTGPVTEIIPASGGRSKLRPMTLSPPEPTAEPEAATSDKSDTKTEPGDGDNGDKPESKDTEPAAEVTAPAQTQPAPQAPEDAVPAGPERDNEAAATAAEIEAAEAKTAREQELEQIIASGKYRVPINAAQRKRSRIHAILWFFVALILAAALLDVLLDMGTITLPIDLPTTHFFTK